eukprot:5822389-Pleurochrysis_carterae.AAC.3
MEKQLRWDSLAPLKPAPRRPVPSLSSPCVLAVHHASGCTSPLHSRLACVPSLSTLVRVSAFVAPRRAFAALRILGCELLPLALVVPPRALAHIHAARHFLYFAPLSVLVSMGATCTHRHCGTHA